MSTDDAPRTSRPVQILLLLLAIGISLAIVWFTNQYQHETAQSGQLRLPRPVRHQHHRQRDVDHSRAGLCGGVRRGSDLRPDRGGHRRRDLARPWANSPATWPARAARRSSRKGRVYEQLHRFMQRHGMLTIFLLGAIPNPDLRCGRPHRRRAAHEGLEIRAGRVGGQVHSAGHDRLGVPERHCRCWSSCSGSKLTTLSTRL